MNCMIRWLAVVSLAVIYPATSQADIIIGFSPDASLTSANVQVGDTFSVDLYYIETTTTLAATNGLLSFGTRGTYSPAIIQFTGGTVDSAFPIVGGGTNPDGSVAGQVDVFGGAVASPNASVIHLATLNFQALAVGTTTISFGDLDAFFDDFTLDDALVTSLDPIVYGAAHPTHSFTVNVSAVPEPGSLAIIALASGSLVVKRMRKSGHFKDMLGRANKA